MTSMLIDTDNVLVHVLDETSGGSSNKEDIANFQMNHH